MHSLLVVALLACGGADAPTETPADAPAPAPAPADAADDGVSEGSAKLLPATRKALDKALETLTPCYETARAANPELQGTWTLRLAIRRDGTVQLKSVRGKDMSDLTLEDCITTKVKLWDLPTVPVAIPVTESVSFAPPAPMGEPEGEAPE